MSAIEAEGSVNDLRWIGLMRVVALTEVKQAFSKLIEAASKGEAIIISKGGKPMVKVVPFLQPEEDPARERSMASSLGKPDDSA